MNVAFLSCSRRWSWPKERGLARTWRVALSAGCALSMIGSGCSVPQRGASASNMAMAQSTEADGSLIFQSYCAECHGPRGAGAGQQPAIVGDQTLLHFETALDLHQYVDAHMPKLGKAELAAADYWAVVGFIVLANGRQLPEGGLSASNADKVLIHAN